MDPGQSIAVGLTYVIVAAFDLDQVLFNVEFAIDRWLVPGPLAASFQVINGMPLAIALAGSALALSRFEGHYFTATTLAGLAGVMAVFLLLRYPTRLPTLYGPAANQPPAPPSARCLRLRPRRGHLPGWAEPRPP